MSEELFMDLASGLGGVEKESIKGLSLRDYYGFVDLRAEAAKTLIGNLDGIEYNDAPLPVEFASRLRKRRE